MDPVLQLCQQELLKDAATDEVEAFMGRCRKKTYPDGFRLFEAKGEATSLYLLLSGKIELIFNLPGTRGEATLTTLQPGDATGWSAAVPPHQYRFTAVCREETTVLEISRPELNLLFWNNYHFAFVFMRNIALMAANRLRNVEKQLSRCIGDEVHTGW